MHVEHCCEIEFPTVTDPRGCLTVIEFERHMPFVPKRVFYLHTVPPEQTRVGHAHKTLEQLIVCLAGGVDVIVDDGTSRHSFRLEHPSKGLYIPPLIWDTEVNFAPGTVCLVLASEQYVEADYFRDYGDFLDAVTQARLAD